MILFRCVESDHTKDLVILAFTGFCLALDIRRGVKDVALYDLCMFVSSFTATVLSFAKRL